MSKKVRVRFAPSPTGPLHIGGVRTALFNYLFAKKHGGDFILRIEDTDQTRLVPHAEAYLNESLEWLGLIPDEGVKQGGKYGPYKQSERKEIYLKYAEILINAGWAYYAFDTPEELDKLRNEHEAEKKTFSYDVNTRMNLKNSLVFSEEETQKKLNDGVAYVVRFKMPENEPVPLKDIIRGEINFNTSTLDDKIIFKSDGLPTYHLANVVDDYEMKISHVIRGEEWLPSLPLHAMLYKALGWENEMPKFAHLPLILKPTGKGKLSKRDGDRDGFPVFPLEWTSAEGEKSSGYRESGYFPEAVNNLLAFLGWNPGTEQELFSLSELIESFSLERVNKSGARFDPEKARWYNQQYLQKKKKSELAKIMKSNNYCYSSHTIDRAKTKTGELNYYYLCKVIKVQKDRAIFISDICKDGDYFFISPTEYDEKTVKKFWKESTPEIVKSCLEILKTTVPFESKVLEEKIKEYITANEMGFGKVMNPLRLATVGAAKGPHLFDIFEIIGRDETLSRIERALEVLP